MSTLTQMLEQSIAEYVKCNPKSCELNKANAKVLPGGTTRSVLLYAPFPMALSGGSGAHVSSIDGAKYLDFVSEYTAGMFGHSHPEIRGAIEVVSSAGFTLGGPNQYEGELARKIVERFPSMDAVRFCNSGTEANTMAIGTALHFTKRKKVARAP